LNVTAGFCVCAVRRGKEAVIYPCIICGYPHAKENRVTNTLKERNHISTYFNVTENSVWYARVWNKIFKEKDCVCTVQQMQKA